MSDEFEIKVTASNKPGWRCPNCHGMGRMQDGSLSIGPDGIKGKLGTKCGVCGGNGRVQVFPLERSRLESEVVEAARAYYHDDSGTDDTLLVLGEVIEALESFLRKDGK